MSEPGPDGGEAGTTLVELLVAVALLSLLALFALQGVAALRAVAPVTARIVGAEERAAVAAHLRRSLSEVVARAPDGAALPFEGNSDALRFLAPADPLLEGGGLVRVTLRAEADGAGVLALVERREPLGRPAAPPPEPVVLLRPVGALRLSYADASGGETRWLDRWEEAGRGLPALARLRVDLPGAARPLDLLVHPASRAAPSSEPAAAPPPPPRT